MANEKRKTDEAEVVEAEVVELGADAGQQMVMVDAALAAALSSAELDRAILTARQFPRSIEGAIRNMISLATIDEETAVACIYTLPRAGKAITGPSIRLAEIVQQCWGNNSVAAMVVAIDRVNKMITAAGEFHDLETNAKTKASVQRRVSDKKGRIYSDDMIAVTGNAACSIARRNAIIAGVPRAIVRKVELECRRVIAGDVMTIEANRQKAVDALAQFGVTPEMIFTALEIKGMADIDVDRLITLRGMYSSLKNEDATVDELFGRGGATANEVNDPLNDRPAGGQSKTTSERAIKARDEGRPPKEDKPAGEAAAEKLVTEARERGAKAKKAGMQRKAIPSEYKGNKTLSDAWHAGFDAVDGAAEQ